MALKIYGIAQSRASRSQWMARELGVPFETVPATFDKPNDPALLAVNPMGQIPAIDDDGFTLAESMAINLYLAKKHGKLAPKTLQDEAKTLQWSFWVMTAIERHALTLLLHRMKYREATEAQLKEATDMLQRPFRVLNDHLAGKTWLVGGEFSVADVNVASVLSWAIGAKMDLSAFPNMAAWLQRCLGRPAFKG